ncbi:MAG: hypothetical protein PWQ77_1716 [Kosmotogales bacterium]|nr:hypothetical protein [Kosmotogales bacterium]
MNESIKLHEENRGKLTVKSRVRIQNKEDLSLAYTPGVADVCKEIKKNKDRVYDLTNKWNYVAIVSDGSAVLGLGNIGPEAGLPVMEGKAVLFKEFGNVDAFPLCINNQDPEEIINFVEMIEPTFGGINLEDICAPKCFYIEKTLKEKLNIPVFHDDQHGAAIIILAALKNALKFTNKNLDDLKVVSIGIGAAGGATIKMLQAAGIKNIVAVDKNGIINKNDPKTLLNDFHKEISESTNPENLSGGLGEALVNADVFIGTSVGGLLTKDMVKKMNKDPIIFAAANPVPEIYPEDAKKAGAKIVATGRSDFPNQINNVLVFPGLFRGALDVRASDINDEMKLAAVDALARMVPESELTVDKIIPAPFDRDVGYNIAFEVAKAAVRSGVARLPLTDEEISQKIKKSFEIL